jgi:hypothetical protein
MTDQDTPRRELIEAIVAGGDERMSLDARGWNRYFVPARQEGVIFCRGSCTCGFLVRDAYRPVDALHRRLEAGADLARVREDQRRRLRTALGVDDDVDVFFAPSGSDLCYLPGLFHRLTRGSELRTLVTACDELGSGSVLAHESRYFSQRNQLTTGNQVGAPVTTPRPRVQTWPTRGPDGRVVDRRDAVVTAVASGADTAVQLVWSSKSGVRDDPALVDEVLARGADVWIDLCQLRPPLDTAAQFLERGCAVMITGSKFFQAPPFCGAVLIPASAADTLRDAGGDIGGYARLFTAFDPPPSWRPLVKQLPDVLNVGLTLRWEAALAEMEAFQALDQSNVASTIEQWRASLVQALVDHVDTFDVISGPGDDPTIVSFRCRRRGRVLGLDELHAVYRRITSTRRSLPGYERAFIGQPVESGGVAMLRLALGANDLRKLQDGSETLDDDHRLVELIAATIGC